jgi:hypothetical protein
MAGKKDYGGKEHTTSREDRRITERDTKRVQDGKTIGSGSHAGRKSGSKSSAPAEPGVPMFMMTRRAQAASCQL